ncbi:MAG: MFS transporter [Verrucomicrobiaceae bacterium]
MAPPEERIAHHLDKVCALPARNRTSLLLVLLVQALNSFSDNFVKMLIIVFAHAVAKGTRLGDNIQVYLGIIFSLPYVFFAPVAGYFSDRHSKKRVIFWMQFVQIFIFAGFIAAFSLRDAQLSVVLGMILFFVLATQAAFFAPAKMGILKELVGSRRLGLVSGVQQMSMFAAILAGYAVAGEWFGRKIGAGIDPWNAAQFALWTVTALAVLQTVAAAFVQRTEEHHDVPWRTSLWWEHFGNMRIVFRAQAVGVAALGIAFFWFMSNGIGTILVGLCNEAFPVEKTSSQMKGIFSLLLGVGVVFGSLLSSVICRRSIRLGIVPAALFALAGVLFVATAVPAQGSAFYLVMTLIGFTAGAFMVPLYGFVLDRSAENERAQVLAGIGLIDCIGGTGANLLVLGLLTAHVSSAFQIGLMGVITIGSAFFMLRLRRFRGH